MHTSHWLLITTIGVNITNTTMIFLSQQLYGMYDVAFLTMLRLLLWYCCYWWYYINAFSSITIEIGTCTSSSMNFVTLIYHLVILWNLNPNLLSSVRFNKVSNCWVIIAYFWFVLVGIFCLGSLFHANKFIAWRESWSNLYHGTSDLHFPRPRDNRISTRIVYSIWFWSGTILWYNSFNI